MESKDGNHQEEVASVAREQKALENNDGTGNKDEVITSCQEEGSNIDDEKYSAIIESEEGNQQEEISSVAREQKALENHDGPDVQTH